MFSIPSIKSTIIFVALLNWALVCALPVRPVGTGSMDKATYNLPNVPGEMHILEARSLAGQCSELDLDDLQSLPLWLKLLQYVKDTWGDGDVQFEVNPSGYDDSPATMCVSNPVLIQPLGPPVCRSGRVDIPRKDGSNEVVVEQGYANVGNWNITEVTTAARALLFQGTFRTPNMTTPPAGTYSKTHLYNLDAHGEFINAPFNSFGTLASNMTHETKKLTQIQDRTCIATVSQQSCSMPAGGRIQLVAEGYVWVTYKKKRAARSNPWGAKHRRFAIRLEEAFKDPLDRSGWIEFQGRMNTTLKSDYFDECRWNFQL